MENLIQGKSLLEGKTYLFQCSEGDDTIYKDDSMFSSSPINEPPSSFSFPSVLCANGHTSTLYLQTEHKQI